ncbi:hypothetical protein [Bathymodiolus platifrons methanotrophic gill symbiont]|nr:hypothetical protein [Bathymodiolus platifrons methanotrophic gill symbiont]
MGMKALLNKAGFSKRSGTPIYELVYVLMLWVWLKKESIGMFARESLQHFTTAEKDALYSIMNREDLNWRKLNLQTALKTVNQMPACQPASQQKPLYWTIQSKFAMARKCQGFPVILTIPWGAQSWDSRF